MSDEQVIDQEETIEAPETQEETEGTQGEKETKSAAKPAKEQKIAPAKGKELSKEDKDQLDEVTKLIASQDLPPEVKYFKDKNGKLQFQVPIGGEVHTVGFKDIIKGFNLNQAGYKKLEEGKALHKQFEGFIGRLKANPDELKAFAERLGLDPIKLAHGWLQKAVEESEMTDEQKELAKFKQEKEAFEKERAEYKKSLEEQKVAAESEKYQSKYSEDLIAALKKHNISADSASFRSMKGIAGEAVKKVKSALEKGIEMTMDDAVFEAKQDAVSYISDFLMSIDDNHIIDALPAGFVDRILKASLNRKVGTPTTDTVGKPVVLKEAESAKKKKQKQSVDEYFAALP